MVTGDTHSNNVVFCFIYFIFFMLALATSMNKCETKLNEKFSLPRKLYLNDVEDWLIVFRCDDRIS